MPTVFILNGPNLNLLGVREPATYGYDTLGDVEQRCLARAQALDLAIDFRQTNHEGQLVDWIHEAREAADGIILNAGALTHTSVAVLDALNAAELPIITVEAPAAIALVMSPENLMPPSAITGTPVPAAAWAGLVAVATIAALLPANRAARLRIVDALRHV